MEKTNGETDDESQIKNAVQETMKHFSELGQKSITEKERQAMKTLCGQLLKKYTSFKKALGALRMSDSDYEKWLKIRRNVLGLKNWNVESTISRRGGKEIMPNTMFWIQVLREVFLSPEGPSLKPEILEQRLPVVDRIPNDGGTAILKKHLAPTLKGMMKLLKQNYGLPENEKKFLPQEEREFFDALNEKWPNKTIDQIIAEIDGNEILGY